MDYLTQLLLRLALVLAVYLLVYGILYAYTFVSALLTRFTASSRRNPHSVPDARLPDALRLNFRCTQTTTTHNGKTFPILEFQTKGVLAATGPILQPCFDVTMQDITDPQRPLPLWCAIEDLQAEDSLAFHLRIPLGKPLEAGSGTLEWITFGRVPVDALMFPRRGKRTIKVHFRLLDLSEDRTITTATCSWFHSHDDDGYADITQREITLLAAGMQLAFAMAASDGNVDPRETAEIYAWVHKVIAALPDDFTAECQQIFDRARREAIAAVRARTITHLADVATDKLKRHAGTRLKHHVYELCLKVLASDGRAQADEMEVLHRVAARLELDPKSVRCMFDDHLKNVEIVGLGSDTASEDQLLGINSSMPKEEIRRRLTEQYRKYHPRLTHSDPKVREDAKAWLRMIVNARKRHLS